MPPNFPGFCRGCPTGSRLFDPDGYWKCKHPEAYKQDPDGREVGDSVPIACLEVCPCGHWKRTIEGGRIQNGQTELIIDAEWMA